MTRIGVFDSGLGGLALLKKLSDSHKAQYFYLGDNKRVPYGAKSKEEIAQYSVEIVRFLEKFDIDFYVIACNTISVNAIDCLEKTFDKKFITVTEMGIRAADEKEGDFLLLATKATVDTHVYKEKIEKISEKKVTEVSAPVLVDLIEKGEIDSREMAEAIKGYLKKANDEKIENIILGCTHYPIIKERIEENLSYPATIIDPADYLCENLSFEEDEQSQVQIFMTHINPISQKMASMIMGRDVEIKEAIL